MACCAHGTTSGRFPSAGRRQLFLASGGRAMAELRASGAVISRWMRCARGRQTERTQGMRRQCVHSPSASLPPLWIASGYQWRTPTPLTHTQRRVRRAFSSPLPAASLSSSVVLRWTSSVRPLRFWKHQCSRKPRRLRISGASMGSPTITISASASARCRARCINSSVDLSRARSRWRCQQGQTARNVWRASSQMPCALQVRFSISASSSAARSTC
mmetsp:Transcript_46129/g.98350  ORF Transcript_46129/g.98350 Transcript_46129/m.98350 type:complete len:216 (+) Transcript_46129:424-1071(+)